MYAFRNHALLRWRNTVLVLVALVDSMAQLVKKSITPFFFLGILTV